MAMSLRDWIKEELDHTVPQDAILSDAYIDSIILKCRILDSRRAYDFLNHDDQRSQWTRASSSLGGRVRITLIDQQHGGATPKQFYGGAYAYYIHATGFQVHVNDVLIAGSAYTFDPFTMTLSFVTARSETSPTVTITGHLVDMRKAHLECGYSLAQRVQTLQDVDGAEYRQLARTIRNGARKRWGNTIVGRGRG